MGEDDMHQCALAMDRIQPGMLWGYAGALHQFALTLTAISSSAAPLTAVQTEEIERILGAPVHQTYRAAGLSLIAGHRQLREGLHIQSDHKLVEIVDDDGRRVPDGEPGEVVVTDLMNHAQPLIRYRLGHIATMSPDPCPCGRPFPVLSSLHGRTNDMIRTREGVVSAYTFASAFAGHPAVRQYQIHQLADYSLVVKIVPGADLQPIDLEDVVRHLSAEMRGSLPVSIEFVDEIPHVRGKHKSVVSNLEVP